MRSSLALLILLSCSLAFSQDKKLDPKKDYALIFGTVFGPDDHPVEGVRVWMRKADSKKPKYERFSDARGEFAQRVPVGPADYVVYVDPKSPALGKKSHLQAGKDVPVHVAHDERQDISLHLAAK